MKNRSLLMLIELTVMLLVFALAAAFCLQGFSSADSLSAHSLALDEACLIAQNAVEILENSGGDCQLAEQYVSPYLQQGGYTLVITPVDTDLPALGQARVSVFKNGESVFALTACWQREVGLGE
ncbi:MAG: hypothetical protein IKD06_01530 [Clostridia bacterium]|nr:hypothetical protein [Clostridia bacterium]